MGLAIVNFVPAAQDSPEMIGRAVIWRIEWADWFIGLGDHEDIPELE